MATAVAVHEALARRWSDDEYEDRMVAIACFAVTDDAGDDEPQWLARQLRSHHGVQVDTGWPCALAVFPRLIDATTFARELRHRLDGRVRMGVTLDVFEVTGDGRPAAGSEFAKELMRQCEPGGLVISAVPGERITTRLAGDRLEPDHGGGLRHVVLTGLQWAGLLGYFLGWSYLIYWKAAHFAQHGSYPCWPQWLCN